MTDEPATDGGARAQEERDVRRAGDRPPDVPTRTTIEDLLPRLLEGADDVGTGFHIRARLVGDDPGRAAERLVEALERKVTVVGTTLDAGVDPSDPQLDVLIECDHTMSQVATALARVAPVDGAIVLDVTEECEHVLEEQAAEETADTADANDVFNELQEQVSEADYDEVVDELEDVSFPGGPDPDEEIDLEAEADVDLETDDEGDVDLGEPSETIDLGEDGGDLDTGDVSAEELFGDDEPAQESSATQADAGTAPSGQADEAAIEEAVQSVESGVDDEPGEEDTDTSAAETDEESPAEAETVSEGAEPSVSTADAGIEDAGADGRSVEDDAPAADAGDDATAGAEAGGEEAAAADVGGEDADTADVGGEEAAAADAGSEEAVATGDGGSAARTQDIGGKAGTADEELERIVDELTEALESGRIGPERRQKLREALGIESNHSLDVRLEYLQKRVDNLAAYTDSWESFLSEEGTGDEFISDIRERLDDLEARAERAGGDADPELVARVEDLEAAVERVDDEARLADIEERVDDHDADVSRLSERVGKLEDAVEKLKGSLQEFADWRDTINSAIRDR